MRTEATPREVGLSEGLGAWVPVGSRLPDLDMPVWLYLPDGPRIVQGCRTEDSDGWYWANCYSSAYFDPTHEGGKWRSLDAEMDDDYQPSLWQPLPEPPRYTQAELDAAAAEARRLVAGILVAGPNAELTGAPR